MAILTYLDASGDAHQPILSVAGFLALEEQWAQFSEQWAAVLAANGVTELHMRHFAHSRGQFTAWKGDETRRAAFLDRLTGVIKANTLQPVAVSLFVDLYNDFNKVFRLRETLGGPYAFTSLFAATLACTWRDQHSPGEPISFVFETGDNDQGDLVDTLHRLHLADAIRVKFMRKKRLDEEGRVQYCYPLQACDFIAYEYTKASRTVLDEDVRAGQLVEEIKARKSLLKFVPIGRDFMSRFIGTELLTEFCKTFRVRRR
jgi:hypothetical protein